MNRTGLTDHVATETGLDAAGARAAVAALLDGVADALARGEEVQLPGLGVLAPRETAARTGRNPRSGEPMQIPAGRRVAFRPAAALKRRLADA